MENKYHKRLMGKKFGKLTVVAFAGLSKGHKTNWLCICECGNQKTARNDSLIQGDTISCGCSKNILGKKNKCWKGHEDISMSFWSSIKRGALERNFEFSISIEDTWQLYLQQNKRCALTGDYIDFGEGKMDISRTASLDRIDSSIGYIKGNIQWVRKDVNIAKQSLSQFDFIDLCTKVAKYSSK